MTERTESRIDLFAHVRVSVKESRPLSFTPAGHGSAAINYESRKVVVALYLRVYLVHIVQVLSEVVLGDAELRPHPFQRSVHAVSLWHLLELHRDRVAARLQPAVHVVRVGYGGAGAVSGCARNRVQA